MERTTETPGVGGAEPLLGFGALLEMTQPGRDCASVTPGLEAAEYFNSKRMTYTYGGHLVHLAPVSLAPLVSRSPRQRNHGRTPAASIRRRILGRYDLRVFGEQRPNDTPLNALPPTVDDTHLVETVLETLLEIFVDYAGYITWSERMQVDVVFERKNDRLVKRWLRLYGARVVGLAYRK